MNLKNKYHAKISRTISVNIAGSEKDPYPIRIRIRYDLKTRIQIRNDLTSRIRIRKNSFGSATLEKGISILNAQVEYVYSKFLKNSSIYLQRNYGNLSFRFNIKSFKFHNNKSPYPYPLFSLQNPTEELQGAGHTDGGIRGSEALPVEGNHRTGVSF